MASSTGLPLSHHQEQQQDPPDPPLPPPPPHQRYSHHPASTTSAATSSASASKSRRHTLPFSFPPLFQSNTSSARLAPSTAEGKPIPVDDSTAEHRTSALRELNSNFPSRHRYAKSTGAQSSTYSQPVIVRSYYTPVPTRPVSTDRGVVIVSRGGAGRRAGSDTGPAAAVRRAFPFAQRVTPSGNGILSNMARARARKRMEGPGEAKLPPVDAFRFKSFLANMEEDGCGTDINADLDRIAEICAKSRYSLSNQYEVHYAPHGSGTGFLSNGHHQEPQGPTLQVVSSDDERNMRRARRRPIGARRNSRAMGTLETIMSSSRSSDEDRSKKKSAAELADDVRGRASRKDMGTRSSTSSSQSGLDKSISQDEEEEEIIVRKPRSRRSGSLALIDGPRRSLSKDAYDHGHTGIGLVGEPALPQTSSSQLEIRTGREAPPRTSRAAPPETKFSPYEQSYVHGAISPMDDPYAGYGFFSTLSGWMPWRASETFARSHGRAEGSLRELLRTTDVKGKGIDRAM